MFQYLNFIDHGTYSSVENHVITSFDEEKCWILLIFFQDIVDCYNYEVGSNETRRNYY